MECLKILVVDDNESDYAYVRELLSDVSEVQFDVEWARNFETAVQVIQQNRHDAYLIDQHLGPRTGVELLSDVRRRNIAHPFIMLTGLNDRAVDRDAMREGAADFLVKSDLNTALLERSIRYAVEHQKLLDEMDVAAKHDALTGLANRRQFQEFLQGAMARAQRSAQALGLLFIDLDHFKQVNDQYGHDAGDRVLVSVSHLLCQCVRRGDLVARLGGDEFAVILDNIDGPDRAAQIAGEMLRLFASNPVTVGRKPMGIGTSIGVAVYPGAGNDADSLIKAADTAMYEAKARGRNNFQCFEERLQVKALRRADIHRSLSGAFAKHELEIHYQAQIHVPSGRVRGVEALVRWRHGGEFISPAEFVPIAEETGQIGALGNWVMERTCLQFKEWELRGLLPECAKLGVNVSAQQLADGEVLAAVERSLSHSCLEAARLELEITETSTFRDLPAAADELQAIRALGVGIALDDFGTGHSSMAYLQKLPINTIKIDQTFVRGCASNKECAVVVKSTLGIARALGMGAIAEGIENQAQMHALQHSGCEVMQGYLFHRPATAPAVEEAFQRHDWCPAELSQRTASA